MNPQRAPIPASVLQKARKGSRSRLVEIHSAPHGSPEHSDFDEQPARKKPKRTHRKTVRQALDNLGFTQQRRPRNAAVRFQLSEPGNDKTICARCRRIDFESILKLRPEAIGPNGAPICRLDGLSPVQRGSRCPMCQLFATAAYGPINMDRKMPPATPQKYKDFFNLLLRRPDREWIWHLHAYSSLRFHGLRRSASRIQSAHTLVLAVSQCPGASGSSMKCAKLPPPDFEHTDEGNIIALVESADVNLAIPTSLEYWGRILSSSKVDYTLIASWLQHCDEEHGRCAPPNPTFKPSRLVDCQTRQIVPSGVEMRYYALSYVWGPRPTREQLSPIDNSGSLSLPELIPRTIEDAITVVRSLGGRYLWVDRYCIDQSNSVDRDRELARMDQIFKASVACIVGTGPDASTGLYGVSQTPRIPQPRVEVASCRLVSIMPPLQQVLEHSEWYRRGWTYQEAQLATRLIIFGPPQVYFVCRQDRQREAVRRSSGPNNKSKERALISESDSVQSRFFCNAKPRDATKGTFARLLDFYEGQDFLSASPFDYCAQFSPISQLEASYHHGLGMHRRFTWDTTMLPQPSLQIQLLEYTSRKLTNDDDALAAFGGMLNRSANMSYFGVPVFHRSCLLGVAELGAQCDMDFAFGLAWARFSRAEPSPRLKKIGNERGFHLHTNFEDPLNLDDRRASFPSWTWASIRGMTGFALAHESWDPNDLRSPALSYNPAAYSHNPRISLGLKDGRVWSLDHLIDLGQRIKEGLLTDDDLALLTPKDALAPADGDMLPNNIGILPELASVLYLSAYRAEVALSFPKPGIMLVEHQFTDQVLNICPTSGLNEDPQNFVYLEQSADEVALRQELKPSLLNALLSRGLSKVDVYLDNPVGDWVSVTQQSRLDLVLLLKKTVKHERATRSFETGWWLLVCTDDGPDGSSLSRRLGLVRSWGRIGSFFPVEERHFRLG